MIVTLQYFTGCPSWQVADERLAALAAERPELTVQHQLVETVEDAERLGFHGSPSIVVDGADVFAGPGTAVGLACRLYQTPDGPSGAPTLDQLRSALARP